MSENVEGIVEQLTSIISDILDKKGILKPENVITNTHASFISDKQVESLVDTSEQDGQQDGQQNGDKNNTVVNNTNSQDTIINVAPNEIIETQETYTIGEDGKIEIQGEPSKEKKYSL